MFVAKLVMFMMVLHSLWSYVSRLMFFNGNLQVWNYKSWRVCQSLVVLLCALFSFSFRSFRHRRARKFAFKMCKEMTFGPWWFFSIPNLTLDAGCYDFFPRPNQVCVTCIRLSFETHYTAKKHGHLLRGCRFCAGQLESHSSSMFTFDM